VDGGEASFRRRVLCRLGSDPPRIRSQLREAHEEIGLPLPPRPGQPPLLNKADPAPLLYLTTLPAYSSRTLLVVLPVVYLLLQPPETASTSCLPSFLKPNPDEVDAIFHLPLQSFLMLDNDNDDDGTDKLSHTYTDYTWLLSRPYRLHSFSTLPSLRASDAKSARHSAVTGLTADIVLDTALLAYYGSLDAAELPPDAVGFERRAQGQMEWNEIVAEALGMQKNAVTSGGGKDGDARRHAGLGARLSPPQTAADERTSTT
jgi:coenzyme A diphosphatase NUDT7